MLIDGTFIKEAPPQIGKYYVRQQERPWSKEELFAQSILIGKTQKKSLLFKVFTVMLKV